MSRRKPTPERSTIARGHRDVAFARRQRTEGDEPAGSDEQKAEPAKPAEAEPVKAEQTEEAIVPPAPKGEPWPDATPEPMRPVEAPRARTNTDTVLMPTVAQLGRPPEMPTTSAPPPLALGAVEDPTHMPGPREVPGGNPEDPAPAPGRVPPGDSRSLRCGKDFALIYRIGTYVISRFGAVGTRGQWRVVEYPTSASASHAYAKECSRFVSEGFSDYRA
ncbi:MAG TPA: hypothetical protein VLX92_20495 [Kofleriaceae bacterium]|nr:hypothetical protein [Kofleriaceae bacterium]